MTEEDIVAGSVKNVATANGENPTEDPDDPDDPFEDDVEDPTEEANPHMTVEKTTTSRPANGESYVLGETITYKITVTNDGNVTFTDVKVDDELTDLHETIKSLAPGESAEFETSYVVTEEDQAAGSVKNVATANGENPTDDPTDPFEDEVEDPVEEPAEDPTPIQFKVQFVDWDGTILKDWIFYDVGTRAEEVERPADPTREADEHYTYEFAGWTPEIADVFADMVYTATYDRTGNKYTVTFVDEDGTILKEATPYEYGTPASEIERPADPTKAADEQYTYEFAGWTPEIADVTEDATYTATYRATPIEKSIPDEPDEPIPDNPTPITPYNPTPSPTPDEPDEPITDDPTPLTPPENDEPGDTDEIDDGPTPLAPGGDTDEIDDNPTPLAPADDGKGSSWALINLLCAIGAVIAAICMIVTFFTKKQKDEYDADEDKQKRRASKFFGLIPAAAAVVIFFLTQDLAGKMQLVDKWTILMAVLFAAGIGIGIATKNKKQKNDSAASVN